MSDKLDDAIIYLADAQSAIRAGKIAREVKAKEAWGEGARPHIKSARASIRRALDALKYQ